MLILVLFNIKIRMIFRSAKRMSSLFQHKGRFPSLVPLMLFVSFRVVALVPLTMVKLPETLWFFVMSTYVLIEMAVSLLVLALLPLGIMLN